jgi:monoamine oxidase
LANSPYELTLYEASSRLGGKVLTAQFSHSAVRYEAGAAEFYDYSRFGGDPLKELIAELGLPIRAMGGPAVVMNQRTVANLDDLVDQISPTTGEAVRRFDRLAKDWMTPAEFYHADGTSPHDEDSGLGGFARLLDRVEDPLARRYIMSMIHSDLATEPAQTNIVYGLQNYLMNDPAYMLLYAIEGGNERLTESLAARVEGQIRLGHRVASIGRHGAKLRVISSHPQGDHADEFDFVVVALPHNHLTGIEFQGERLAAAFRRHLAHYNYPAHYLRITLLFDKPFWRNTFADSYWMLDEFGGCCLYDESARDPGNPHGILGCLLGGDAALEMSAWSDDQLIGRILESLPPFLNAAQQTLLEGQVHRWINAVNAMPGGATAKSFDQRHVPEPIAHSNLFVVGDYLYDSTLNGVLDSAEYVAGWLAALMTEEVGRK